MKYDTRDRQAIGGLLPSGENTFRILEKYEQGTFLAVPQLCTALGTNPIFVAFSCLTGSGRTKELHEDPGVIFRGGKIKTTSRILDDLKNTGHAVPLCVILDDCEPRRVWQWDTPQEEITAWCEMIIEDVKNDISSDWDVIPWSRIERGLPLAYDDILGRVSVPRHALLLHQQLDHMKRFPNKKLIGDMRDAAQRRIAEYALQGKALEEAFPHAILLQTETPWRVKDPLYALLRNDPLPIIHPYPEERR